MLRFKFVLTDGDVSEMRELIDNDVYLYPTILYYCGDFQIIVDEQVFFSDHFFPILEFLKDATKWMKNSEKTYDLSFSSIETIDNPVLSFHREGEKWSLYSPWQLFECSVLFDHDDISNAIVSLVHSFD